MPQIGQLNSGILLIVTAELDCRTQYILKELREAGWREKEKGEKVDFLSVP